MYKKVVGYEKFIFYEKKLEEKGVFELRWTVRYKEPRNLQIIIYTAERVDETKLTYSKR